MAQQAVQLRIIFDGTAPGLEHHRLSVAAFVEPLRLLLQAYRRIASALVRDMLDTPEYGRAGGKYAEQAKVIDLEIFEIQGNSPLQIAFECTTHIPIGGQFDLYSNGLLKRAGETLLDGIKYESKGELRNAAVRRYLQALPPGIREQRYRLMREQEEIIAVTVTNVDIAPIPDQLPYLEKIEGEVVGIGFAPGPTEVRIRQENNLIIVLSGTDAQVAAALALRGKPITAMVLTGKTKRLLWIRPRGAPETQLSYEQAVEYIDRRWGGLLKRLAE